MARKPSHKSQHRQKTLQWNSFINGTTMAHFVWNKRTADVQRGIAVVLLSQRQWNKALWALAPNNKRELIPLPGRQDSVKKNPTKFGEPLSMNDHFKPRLPIQPSSSKQLSPSLLHPIYHLRTKAIFLHKYEELVRYSNSVPSPTWCRLGPFFSANLKYESIWNTFLSKFWLFADM